MKTRFALVATLVAAVALGSLFPAQAAKKSKPVVVGTDADDDWGANADPTIAPAGDALGMELVEASIGMADPKTVNFIIKVKSLPPVGGTPEFVRYVWTVMIDGELLQLDGKFTNFSRAACDPTAGTCPPPRNPGTAPFLVRGNCTDNGGAAVTCEEIGLVNGTFDVAAATITVPVSLELLGAKPGSKIEHGTQPGSNFAGVWAIPSAFVSQGNMPLDELLLTKAFVVPR
ncbi:MAG TPA: hypothetical protein VG408_10725 [Actinomycetota bacterium]|nr:hypothetical protein [Actinomycetota bacterium]